jgi:hypothetical protein
VLVREIFPAPVDQLLELVIRRLKKTLRSRAVNYGDDLNRSLLPSVGHHIRIEIPEPIALVEEFLVVVAHSGRLSQAPERLVELPAQTFRGLGAVIGDVEENVTEVGFGLGSEPE